MSADDCGALRDRLPDLALGRIADEAERLRVLRHVEVCASCAAERTVVERILAARPDVPPGLAADIKAALADGRGQDRTAERAGRGASEADEIRGGLILATGGAAAGGAQTSSARFALRRSRWGGLSAAAVLIVAAGTAVVWRSASSGTQGARDSLESELAGLGVEVVEALPESWRRDDGIVAGGVVLDALTDEALASLLAELEG